MSKVTLPEGWLTDEEAAALTGLAAGRTVLELGAWKGRSTVVFAEAAEYVVSVDRHGGIAEVGGEDSLPDYLAAVRGYENVAIVVADFARFVPFLDRFGLVYVDGDHDVAAVEDDTMLALTHAERGGMVAFHDWDFQEVRDGAYAVLGLAPLYRGHAPDGLVGSVAWFRV